MKHKKLELQWANKNKSLYFDIETGKYEWVDKKDPRVSEPRILIEKESFGDANSENLLIKGDNLLALKALLQDYQNKIRLIVIDPPYNTGNAFKHYDDGLEHSIWLSLMKARLEVLYQLLKKDGSIWITIDDDECHYLKVLCDEIFGRKNFVANVVWQKRTSPDMRATVGAGHDHILVFAKDIDTFKTTVKPLQKTPEQIAKYKNPDNDPRGVWVSSDFTAQGYRPNQMYKIVTPGGKEYTPPEGRCWKNIESVYLKLVEEGRMWFGKDGNGVPRRKTYLSESEGQVAWTWWTNSEVGHNQEAKKEIIALFGTANVFETPKPERLIQRIIQLGSVEGDIVLDSFAGSGTSGAVAHKMGRKWIMVELGNHAETHIIPRMKAVISGSEQGGISKIVDWKGGGGFKYFELGDSLFIRDDDLKLTVINPKMYNGALIRAVLKVEGFRLHNPDNGLHGISGTTGAHVTEQYLTQAYIDTLLGEVGDEVKFLVIYAKTISSKIKLPESVEVKRIPEVLLKRFTV